MRTWPWLALSSATLLIACSRPNPDFIGDERPSDCQPACALTEHCVQGRCRPNSTDGGMQTQQDMRVVGQDVVTPGVDRVMPTDRPMNGRDRMMPLPDRPTGEDV